MYLRFISPFPGDMGPCKRDVDCGIFQAVRIAREEGLIPSIINQDLKDELAWFSQHLTAPKDKYFTRRYGNVSICWFREDAEIFIQRAWRIAALLRAADIWITLVRTNNPGIIVYSDQYQIIARPGKSTPTKWG